MEKYITGTGQNVLVHDKAKCRGSYCIIHNPSNHCMRGFPTHWRDDRKMMERICPHGIGHPDPDDVAYYMSIRKKHLSKDYYTVHGCCGICCKDVYR